MFGPTSRRRPRSRAPLQSGFHAAGCSRGRTTHAVRLVAGQGYAELVESFVRAARNGSRGGPSVTAPAPRSAVWKCSSLRGRVCLERSTFDDWRHKKAIVPSDRTKLSLLGSVLR